MIRTLPLTPEVHDLIAPLDGIARDRRCATGMAVYLGDALVGMGGLMPYWPGHAEGWLIPASCRRRHLVAALRWGRRWLDEMQKDASYRRVCAHIRWDAPYRVTMVRALGFEFEARLRAWGPEGADYGLYSRLRMLNG